ncbi:MAG TPA: response regulator transcription factor [Solirubrobacterales bacterium]|jgi:DNA-binding NarL/FixJ family response regulator|nr:response regulator transcription factor [Solirubrobacterales bacterium]
MISVLVAEDHTVMRGGLVELLSVADDLEVVGTAVDGAEAIELAEELRPDVVLMDISMPDVDGIRATGSILEARSETRVVMLTAFSDRDRVVAALDAGAIGYLLKDSEPQEVLEAVRAAARGDAPLAPRAARQLLAARSEEQRADLSKREREVLSLVAEGLPNKLIARRLEISEKTVKTHLTSVFQRIGVSDRTQAALWAQRQGFGTSEQG